MAVSLVIRACVFQTIDKISKGLARKLGMSHTDAKFYGKDIMSYCLRQLRNVHTFGGANLRSVREVGFGSGQGKLLLPVEGDCSAS